MKITGQCHCGDITFTATVDPARVALCHCADCQAFSGAPFRAIVPARIEDFALVGKPKQFVKVAASGSRRAQVFCGECGTQLYGSEPESPRGVNIRLGCVNERAQLAPTLQLWGRSAMPWLRALPSVPAFATGPGSASIDLFDAAHE